MTAFPTLLIAVACATACVDTPSVSAGDGADVALGEGVALEIDLVLAGEDPEDPICDLLPPCGICSLVCDLDALEAALPENTCAALLCPLTDGRTITVHACHL